MGNKHTLSDLYQMQAMPLSAKIRMTKYRIKQWVDKYGEYGVYVSFSGGKDSTVLLDIVRQDYPNIPAMFIDVPTQYPELRDFAKTFNNIEIIKPKISFMDVCKKYGFPMFSKEISGCIGEARKYFEKLEKENTQNTILTDLPYAYRIADLVGIDRRKDKENPEYQNIKMGNIPNAPVRTKQLLGIFKHRENGVDTGEYSKMYDRSKYIFMLDAKFACSDMCCKIMKKAPAHEYGRRTERKAMTAQMASESKLRTSQWIKNGCNGFDMKTPISNPMSFWTEQDVLLYIKLYGKDIVKRKINNSRDVMFYGNRIVDRKTGKTIEEQEFYNPICSVYGDVAIDYDAEGSVDGQMDLSDLSADYGLFDIGNRPLKTTGCSRTGCVLCGFGCHLEKPGEGRFERLKETHPGMYKLLDVIKNNGVTYREAIDWINEHGNMNIRY